MLFCGHAPKNAALILEAAGLGNSVINITSAMIAMGMGLAMDTLAAQAWGAGSYKKLGVPSERHPNLYSYTAGGSGHLGQLREHTELTAPATLCS